MLILSVALESRAGHCHWGLWSPAGGWPFLAAAMHHQPLPAAPRAAASQARPLKASHTSSPTALSLTSSKQSFGPASDIHPWGGKIQTCRPRGALDGSVGEHSEGQSQTQRVPWAKGPESGCQVGHQQAQGLLQVPCPEHSTQQQSKPRWCACLYTQMQRNYKIVTSLWKTAARWQIATAQPGAYCPVSGQWHCLF